MDNALTLVDNSRGLGDGALSLVESTDTKSLVNNTQICVDGA